MTLTHARPGSAILLACLCLTMASCQQYDPGRQDEAKWLVENEPEQVPTDEAGARYPTHPYDAFKGMDSHVKDLYDHEFSLDEIKGRNTWVMWSGGNQEMWDYLARNSNGIVDFLKLCDSRFVRRADRFRIMGVVPHPGMKETLPAETLGRPSRSNHYGLHLDTYTDDYDQYGRAYVEGPAPDPRVYGYSSGIVGLRLFPRAEDPDPRIRAEWEKHQHKWDPERYLYDEEYYKDPKLIRPYRIGMSCGFCHINANPMNPPKHMDRPKWAELSSNIGNQYFWFGRIFGADFKRDNALYYLLNYPEPGTLDTSLVATDGNNNPNTMNSVYQLLPRIIVSLKSPKEVTPEDTLRHMPRLDEPYDIDGDGNVVGPNDVQPVVFTESELEFIRYLGLPKDFGNRLPPLGDATSRHTPKILAGGADSIGGRGALCRVYLNIGEFSSEWRQLHNTMIGVTKQRPFLMSRAAESSEFWNVTMRRSTNVAKYFLAGSVPMRLEHAPGVDKIPHPKSQPDYAPTPENTGEYGESGSSSAEGDASAGESSYPSYVLPNSHDDVKLGARVFARDCFVCHSSVSPWELPDPDRSPEQLAADELKAKAFWADAANWKKWVNDPDYVTRAADWLERTLDEPVDREQRDGDPFFEKFVKTNYLSTEARYHVSDIGTNTGRALADNGGRKDRMWASYTSQDFKDQKRVATIVPIAHPYDRDKTINWPLNTEAGPGRYRPQSLSSMWAHGPYLHNNSVGYYPYEYGPDPRPGLEGESLSTFSDGIQSVETRVRIFEDGTRRLLGLPADPDWVGGNAGHRGFSESPRRGFDSIVRFEKDCALALPSSVVPNLIEMQTMVWLGVGIPPWLQFILLVGLLIFGIYLLVKGIRRARAGEGKLLRNVASVLVGLVLILGLVSLWQKDEYRIGHIPKDTPVNLIVNINGPGWATSTRERRKLLAAALVGLKKADKYQVRTLEDPRLTVKGRPLVEILLALSKCPDLVLDRGHEFGEFRTPELALGVKKPVSVQEREALIEFLKKL